MERTMSDDFSCYNLPHDYFLDWRQLEPTFYWASASSSNFSYPSPAPVINDEQEKPKSRSTSAYALFFRERQSIEKQRFPNATFGQLSQLIAKQWESLKPHEKRAYKTRCEKDRKKNIARAVEEKARKLLSSAQFSRNPNQR